MVPLKKIPDLLRHVQSSHSNPKAMNHMDDGVWHSISTETYLEKVKFLTLGLFQIGFKSGNKVGILANPSPNWSIANFSIIMAGGIVIPLFANISDENFVFESSQTNLKILFVCGEDQWKMFNRNRSLFHLAIAMDKVPTSEGIINIEDVIKMGDEIHKQQPELYSTLENLVKEDDVACIVYTSGSTGIPKGAVLTNKNLVSIIHVDVYKWNSITDRYLNVLPLAHIFGYSLHLVMLAWGISLYYFNDLKNLAKACQEIHPTVICVVPRLLEKVHNAMLDRVQKSGMFKRNLGNWAFELATSEDSIYRKILYPIADKIVYEKLREVLGGSLRVVVSGGAPLHPHLCKFFTEIGVPIYEGWGLTEAASVTVNILDKHKTGTVGPPLKGMVIKTNEAGEVLVKGPIVMKEYYLNPEATRAVLDADGWLHTGDRGIIDSEGFLTIIGRIKELYKTSTGEYIAPVPIEQALCRNPLIDMAMVIGEGRKFASCLLFPDFSVLESMKKFRNQGHLTNDEFLNGPFVTEEINKVIETINQHLNRWEQIHAFAFVPTQLTIEDGDLTPSMKIRREVVAKKYEHVIDMMYAKEEIVA